MIPEPCLRFVPSVMFKGKRVRAFGSQPYFRHPEETFHEFLIVFLRETLGREWWVKQNTEKKKHVVKEWFERGGAWRKQHHTDEFKLPDGRFATTQSGDINSLTQCAYDFLILHHRGLLAPLLNRFRDKQEFQGVRYEIVVAAIFIRAGFSLQFIEPVHSQNICEFVATHPSGLRAAVEAKSRHRSGFLNEKGTQKEDLVPDLKKKYEQARAKKPDMPFFIFLDINLPYPGIPWEDRPWLEDIKGMMSWFHDPTPEAPDPHNGVIFTNFSSYYQRESVMQTDAPLFIISQIPKYPVSEAIWNGLIDSVNNYTLVPTEI